ncbi:hypothetical protein [Paenibacillus hamazuiensis]|uniref:hypothetical protein n=1 Tax=Paenibacillus hamazuiensis TaxID=2936508 RepID=UPI00200F5D39|nr:hypothetical protein [Paenibacillus hamazuiensis]
MKISFRTTIRVNLKKVLAGCVVNVPEQELLQEIKEIVGFWSEQRLYDNDWPVVNEAGAIREHLLENGLISEENSNEAVEDMLYVQGLTD